MISTEVRNSRQRFVQTRQGMQKLEHVPTILLYSTALDVSFTDVSSRHNGGYQGIQFVSAHNAVNFIPSKHATGGGIELSTTALDKAASSD